MTRTGARSGWTRGDRVTGTTLGGVGEARRKRGWREEERGKRWDGGGVLETHILGGRAEKEGEMGNQVMRTRGPSAPAVCAG